MNFTLSIFVIILLITLAITYWAAKRTSTTADFYAADSQLTAAQNGFALAGGRWARRTFPTMTSRVIRRL